jgi:hypothetical protein
MELMVSATWNTSQVREWSVGKSDIEGKAAVGSGE